MIHNLTLYPAPFDAIKKGYKSIEMRLNEPKRQAIKVGDEICFENLKDGRKITMKVIGLYRFKNFEELYARFPKEKLGYLPQEKASPKDMEKYYSKEKISTFGALGIELE